MSAGVRVHVLSLRMSLAYLLESEAGLILVDAGMAGEGARIVAQLKALGRDDLRLIFITHAHSDHFGAAAEVREQTGAPVAVHRADAAPMARGETVLGTARGAGHAMRLCFPLFDRLFAPVPLEADILFEDGHDFAGLGLDARVLHTPGHTIGSSSLLVSGRRAFVGDLLSTTSGPHLQRYLAQDWPALGRSLARLKAAAPELTYPGHGPEPLSAAALQQL